MRSSSGEVTSPAIAHSDADTDGDAGLKLEFAIDAITPPPPSELLEYDDFFASGQRLSFENLERHPDVEELDEPPLITATQLERRARFRRWVGRSMAVLGVLSAVIFLKQAFFAPPPLGEATVEPGAHTLDVSALTVRAAIPDEAAPADPPTLAASPEPATAPTSSDAVASPAAAGSLSDAVGPATSPPGLPAPAPATSASSNSARPAARAVTSRTAPHVKPPKRKAPPKPAAASRGRALRTAVPPRPTPGAANSGATPTPKSPSAPKTAPAAQASPAPKTAPAAQASPAPKTAPAAQASPAPKTAPTQAAFPP